jgi:hypothetical protein
MATERIIDYSKFKCEVFAPDGTFIGVARMNKAKVFYYPGLVPGQKYDLVFSYDEILLVIITFMGEEVGKVVYLSPAHILYNKGVEYPSSALVDCIQNKIDRSDDFNVPMQGWAVKTLKFFDNTASCI